MSKEIKIPFKDEFRKSILSGKKTMTTRTKPYGTKWDFFSVFGANFYLASVEIVYLSYVAARCFEKEGFGSRNEFIKYWEKLHPRKKYDGSQKVYLHKFCRLSEE